MKLRGDLCRYMLMAVTFCAITFAAIRFRCEPYRVLPLYVSLVVMLLQTKASRFSFLLGGCNAAYYAAVYLFLKLYGMALYSLLVACPIQILAYIRWKKRTDAQGTQLKRLTGLQRLGSVAGFGLVWVALYFILGALGSGYIILDNTISIISTAANLASMLCLIEFPYIQCLSHILNITLYIRMIETDPKQWTFLVYTVYALICGIISAVYMQKLYTRQKNDKLRV